MLPAAGQIFQQKPEVYLFFLIMELVRSGTRNWIHWLGNFCSRRLTAFQETLFYRSAEPADYQELLAE
jgi:hypothetical protein